MEEDIDYDQKIGITLKNSGLFDTRLAIVINWELIDIKIIGDSVFFSIEDENGEHNVSASMQLSDYNKIQQIKREINIDDILNDT